MASRRQHLRHDEKERKAELLDRLLRDDRDRLLRQARFHSERPQDAEDAVGDACVQFLLHFEGEGVDDARRWLLVVVKRRAWAIARRRRERGALVREVSAESLEDDLGIGVASERRGPEELIEAAEEVAAFAAALGRLKVDERRALMLFVLGHSYAEIAALCGWTPRKVHRSLAEGRARLRGLLAEGGDRS